MTAAHRSARVRRVRRAVAMAAAVATGVGLLAPASNGTAATLYVDKSNPSCSDSGTGTAGAPYCTINAGAKVATAGQTVQVAAGTYDESVKVVNSGVAGSPIVVRAAAGATVIVTSSGRGFAVSGRSYVTIQGFVVRNNAGAGIHLTSSSHITVLGNDVSYSGLPESGKTAQGIYLSGVSSSLVSGNASHHNSNDGIYLTGGTTGVTVSSNRVYRNARGYVRAAPGINVISSGNTIVGNVTYDNEDSGIQLYTGGNNTTVLNNVTYNNGDHGIDNLNVTGGRIIGNAVYRNCTSGINVEGTSGNYLVENNIAVDNAVYPAYGGISCSRRAGNIGIYDDAVSGTTANFNIVHLTTAGILYRWGSPYYSVAALQAATGQEGRGLEGDPRWVNPAGGDFRLAPGSFAIDSADSGASGQLATDLAGMPRVDDPSTPNRGAGPRAYDDRGPHELQPGQTGPAAPVLTASAGNAVVNLTWTAPIDGGSPITGYRVYRGTTSGGGSLLTTVGAGTSYNDTTAANGTTYYYEVSAVNAVGEGARSNEASATPQAPQPPAAPTLSASAGNALARLTWTVPTSGGSAITGYRVYRGTASGAQSLLTTVGPVTSYDDTTAANGTTYYYRVAAVNAVGEGLLSNETSATPQAPTAPAAPVLTATMGDSVVELTWTAPDDGGSAITGYQVYRGTTSGEETLLDSTGVGASYSDTAVVNDTTYYYRVAAVNAVGEGSLSNETSATPTSRPNLIPNPGWETDSQGWNGMGATSVTRVAGGYTGGYGALVTNTGPAGATCTLNDSPNWVTSTLAGTYTAGLWVRADTAGASLKFKIREYSGSTNVGADAQSVTLSTTWQLVSVSYTVASPGSTLDFQAYVSGAPTGDCFYADEASIIYG